MSGTVEPMYPASTMIVALRRQTVAGTPNLTNMVKVKASSVDPHTPSNMSDPGIEIGTGSDTAQPEVKEAFMPGLDLSGHLRVGALPMNLFGGSRYMILSRGTDPTSAVTTTLAVAVTARHANSVTVADASGYAVGDWLQIGELATTTPTPVYTNADRVEVHQIQSIAANVITLASRLLYTYASTTPVKKVRNDRKVSHRFLHMPLALTSAGASDLWTAYVTFTNGTSTVSLVFYDGKVESFNTSFQTGQLPGYQASMKFRRVTRDPSVLSTATFMADPSSVLLQNTRGSSLILGDDQNHPRQIDLKLSTPITDDLVLNSYYRDSIVQLSHSLEASSSGKFIKAFFDQVIFGGAGNYDVSDAIPEGAFNYTAQSATLIGGNAGDPYAFGLTAPDAQFSGYEAKAQGGGMVEAGIEKVRIIPSPADDTERWIWAIDNLCTTGVCAAA